MKRTTRTVIHWKTYAFFVLLAECVGALSGFLTRNGITLYEQIEKPSLSPPGSVFPIVWALLFALMGIGAARIWLSPESTERSLGLRFFFLQLIVNFFWPFLFFQLQAFSLAFFWLLLLWILVIVMICTFSQTDSLAAYLQLPYLLWLTFAAYLNYMVWMLNA